jgi:methionine aminopeptidase
MGFNPALILTPHERPTAVKKNLPGQPGTTTAQIDAAIHDLIVQRDAYPSPLGYHGFPKSVTSSVNNVICRESPGAGAGGFALAWD